MAALQDEVLAVSKPAGIHLDASDLEWWHGVFAGLGDQQKTSTLQDVEAGRPTEVRRTLTAGRARWRCFRLLAQSCVVLLTTVCECLRGLIGGCVRWQGDAPWGAVQRADADQSCGVPHSEAYD